MRAVRAFVIGVGAAYFFDPRLGKGRRTVVRDRGLKELRRLARLAEGKTRFVKGKAQGVYARGRRLVTPREPASDDSVVEQRIRSEAFRDLEVDARDVDVEVSDGVAKLSGEVPDEDAASEVVERVEKVEGVEEVVATLRASGGGV
jgi:translation elongation factor EF-1beta